MQAPTLLLVQRPDVSITDVTNYKHPIPVERERIDIGQVRVQRAGKGRAVREVHFPCRCCPPLASRRKRPRASGRGRTSASPASFPPSTRTQSRWCTNLCVVQRCGSQPGAPTLALTP